MAKESNQKEKNLITKDMLIGEVAQNHPESIKVMFECGMHCIGCGMVAYETLEEGCRGHGMSDKDINKMIDEMNKIISKPKK